MRFVKFKKYIYSFSAIVLCASLLLLSGCAAGTGAVSSPPQDGESQSPAEQPRTNNVVTLSHYLDEYEPRKQEYNFYLTYKLVHPWWDAVVLGIEGAVKQYAEKGIIIRYEYLAPTTVSADDQILRIRDAAERGFDVIGVDVADIEHLTPVINELIDSGKKVMTFSSSDASEEDGCRRIAYVGNTHNYEDGAALTEVLCEKLQYKGKVAMLVGSKGAPCHEDRAKGAKDVLAKYPDMELVAVEYDDDSIDKAYALAEEFLSSYPDIDGIICCNMSNPVGAAKAVVSAGKEGSITIVGMDHDQAALHYLKDGVIYALGVQDCYSIGFDTIQTAVKIADGVMPSDSTYPVKTQEKTTIIYADRASELLMVLFGDAG